jgi:hypothetical protein
VVGLGDGVEGWELYTLSDGGESLSGWETSFILIEGLARAFVWMETLAESYGWHCQGCLRA